MRTFTAATTADAVRWERPGDAEQTWFWDQHLCPAPVSPLTQSFYPYATQAFSRNQREFWERRGALRVIFVSGYLYVNPDMGGRPPASAAACPLRKRPSSTPCSSRPAATRAKEDHKLWIEQLTPGAVRAICADRRGGAHAQPAGAPGTLAGNQPG